jgi:hypothetical protein
MGILGRARRVRRRVDEELEGRNSLVAVEAILDVSPDIDTGSHDGW